MGFLFVRRSRYEALRKDLYACRVEINRKDNDLLLANKKANEWNVAYLNERKAADAAEAKLNAIAKILSGETKMANLPNSESVLEGECPG